MKREETDDIIQYLRPILLKQGIPEENIKIDVSTEQSERKRGDVWVSLQPKTSIKFESEIVALIEAKHRHAIIGDPDWRDAMQQGRQKALKQKLNYYIVTNCKTDFRFYNAHNNEEIELDGQTLSRLVSLEILVKIQTQVSLSLSQVTHKMASFPKVAESKFRSTLNNLAHTYRSAGLKKGDDRIDMTISLVVLKYISESEKDNRTLNQAIRLWDDLYDIAYDRETGDLKATLSSMCELIWGEKSDYKENIYQDFTKLVSLSPQLLNSHYKELYRELNQYQFHGANFDLFGTIYEEYASPEKKKEFGEFYTRRNIAGMVARKLLRDERNPRDLTICDPACGSGGFLTESYKTLLKKYNESGQLNETIISEMQKNAFWGYDNDAKSVARTKLNMFLVGDGHTHIYETRDSLADPLHNKFDYVITNPPMGKYKGSVPIEKFDFTKEKRYELLFTELAVKATKAGGYIAIILNDGALETPSRSLFRRRLLESCDINAIISLTKFAFAPYTKEKTYIIFMQKKQKEVTGIIQSFPIWHFIVDYDGYANSDKRYRTKYHDDLPELEEKFDQAVALAKIYITDKESFNIQSKEYEREVNPLEEKTSLNGMKYGYVHMKSIRDTQFYNLLSEYYLRPYEKRVITEDNFNKELTQILQQLGEAK